MVHLGILTAHHYPRLGGMEYATHFIANELQKSSSIQVSLSCNSLKGISKEVAYKYNCYRAKSLSYLTPWLFKYNQDKMIREQKVNLLYGPMLHGGGYYCYNQSLRHNIPFIAHSHGSDVQTVAPISYGALLDDNLKKRVETVIKNADHLIAVSQINKTNMIDLGAEESKISIIHNGIHMDMINAIPFECKRAFLGVEQDDFLVISVGRNKPVKRIELLFEAFKKLKDYEKIKCISVGPFEELVDLAKKHDVLDKVIFTGQIPKQKEAIAHPPFPDLINLYRSANLYVSTSYVEAFSLAATEALACGIPVIIGEKHGVKDVIYEGKTGWIMDKETPSYLADMILDLYNKKAYIKKNDKLIKDSVAHLTWKNVANQMKQTYKKVL
ncbi:glycosyltransferase family 4 protein [Flavivirga sp. 57AJ16]|uniref:glycosyltransferase family 4 protein n=1 Tax=Flavivirga sp. 57AJ16 TaxID=3025307 RepID=UPI0023672B5C|nr:glycosyltransferase family 4 protein [Flavivirga sp. 57AJ16]MDD7886236.1 glycosyltransferase family 4 protein [Flavivirga sp. 57AJ16]